VTASQQPEPSAEQEIFTLEVARPPRPLPRYADLGPIVVQEIPYECATGSSDDRQNVEVLNLIELTQFPPVNYPGLTPEQNQALENKFAPTKMVRRFGWLADHAVWEPDAGIHPPFSSVEDPDVPREKLYFLVDGNGQYLTDPDGTKIQFTKVVLVPYRWRRPNTSRLTTRQTYLAICYSGPSSQ
jgi:hypothetical protein